MKTTPIILFFSHNQNNNNQNITMVSRSDIPFIFFVFFTTDKNFVQKKTSFHLFQTKLIMYLERFSQIADNSVNCGPVLNWLQMDNKGHRLLVPSEESRSINTPAVAAAYSVRRYVSQVFINIIYPNPDTATMVLITAFCTPLF